MTNEYCDYCQGLQREIVACGCCKQAKERYANAIEEKPKTDFASLQIEKDIPLITARPFDGLRQVIAKMEVNDSVLVPGFTRRDKFHHLLRLPDKKFTSRKVEGGVRVWRIARPPRH